MAFMSISQFTFHPQAGGRIALGLALVLGLSACDDAGDFDFQNVFAAQPDATTEQPVETGATKFVEQDVEAPDVFSANEAGLWDGRPSLGGVWVAHPDVTDPERVLIRNQTNGKFVVGALFRRERENPGPRLQLSSDAAQALDVLAGAPVELEVVALRKEQIPVAPPAAEPDGAIAAAIAAPDAIEEAALDPIAAAEAAIEAAPPTQVEPETVAAAAQAEPQPVSTLPVSTLDKPFLQVGIFSTEKNAERAAGQMRSAGLVPTVRQQQSSGKSFWRVLVGPATSASEREKLLKTIKNEGYTDAYAVTN
jgi:cell division septation protein DedD